MKCVRSDGNALLPVMIQWNVWNWHDPPKHITCQRGGMLATTNC